MMGCTEQPNHTSIAATYHICRHLVKVFLASTKTYVNVLIRDFITLNYNSI